MRRLMMTLFGLALLAGSAAAADGAGQGTVDVDAQLREALDAFKAGRANAALTLLQAAEGKATPAQVTEIQFYKARCFIELNRPVEARQALERYIAESSSRDAKERGRRWMAKVKRRFFGALRVECTDGGKRLSLKKRGGAMAQGCPAQWDELAPGRYTVTDGEKTWAVEVVAGKRVVLDLERDRRTQSDLAAEPTPMRIGWGGFARAGGSMVEGTVDEAIAVQGGPAIGAGGFVDLIWQFSAVDFGVRTELAWRNWQFSLSGDGRESVIDTHGLMVPLLAVLGVPYGFSGEAGIAAEYLISGPDDIDTRLAMHLVGGLGWDLPVDWGRPRITVRYLREVVEGLDPNLDLRRQSVTAGVAFGL